MLLFTPSAWCETVLLQEPMTELSRGCLKFIEHGSEEYEQAAQLRYRLFYQSHKIPFESIFDDRERQDIHVAITNSQDNRVLAYGRLAQNSPTEYQIYQMVVEPECQGQGFGARILQALIEAAVERGANRLVLKARVSQVGFYQKLGFSPVGEVFASLATGVPHVAMQKKLM